MKSTEWVKGTCVGLECERSSRTHRALCGCACGRRFEPLWLAAAGGSDALQASFLWLLEPSFFWWQLQTWTSSHLDRHVKAVHLSSCTKSFTAPYAAAKCWTAMLRHTDGNSRHDRTMRIKPMPLHFITYKWTPSVAHAAFKVYVLCAFVLVLNLSH